MGVKNVMFFLYIATLPLIPSHPGRGNLDIATLKLALMPVKGGERYPLEMRKSQKTIDIKI